MCVCVCVRYAGIVHCLHRLNGSVTSLGAGAGRGVRSLLSTEEHVQSNSTVTLADTMVLGVQVVKGYLNDATEGESAMLDEDSAGAVLSVLSYVRRETQDMMLGLQKNDTST